MLILNLPTGVESGEVKINGRKAEARYDRAARTLAFRYLPDPGQEPGPWDVRDVLQVVPMSPTLMSYCCSSAAG